MNDMNDGYLNWGIVLDKFYSTLTNGELSNSKIEEGVKSLGLINICGELIRNSSNDEFLNEEKNLITLEKVIKILQYIYNDTDLDMLISDDDYDRLYSLLLTKTGKNIIGSVNIKDRPIAFHNYPDLRGTLDKVHFITRGEKPKGEKRKSLEEWLSSCENRLGRKMVCHELDVIMTPKWDGLSCVFECENGKVIKALTRGDVSTNEAVDLSTMFYGLPSPINQSELEAFGLKTEIVMEKSNYDELVKREGAFKNQRSIVSSILNTKDLDRKYLPYLTIMPLQYQTEDKEVPSIVDNNDLGIPFRDFNLEKDGNPWYVNMKQEMDALLDAVEKQYPGVNIDGIVIRLTDSRIQELLGRDDGINKFEVAYKTPPQTKKSFLKKIEFNIGILGNVTPVAKIEPIVIKGNTIQNISLGSIERAKSLQLSEGDEVIIKYDVIPYLEIDSSCSKSSSAPIEIPSVCPHCGELLVEAPVLKCVNENCDVRQIGKIINYVEKMKIPFMNEGIITTLFNNGYLRSIADLYTLRKNKKYICDLDGFGEKSFEKIMLGIESITTSYDYMVIGALGIPYIGQRILKKILDIYYLGELIQICTDNDLNKLVCIEGIQEVTAKKIIEGINSNIKLIMFLQNNINLLHEENDYTQTVCFTKVRDKDFEKYLETHKIKVAEKYSKEVDVLIIPNMNTSSSKVEKAVKQGKEILDIKTAYKRYGFK